MSAKKDKNTIKPSKVLVRAKVLIVQLGCYKGQVFFMDADEAKNNDKVEIL